MERYCSTGQSPQRAVAPTEEEEFGPLPVHLFLMYLLKHVMQSNICSITGFHFYNLLAKRLKAQ
jgi:hypothetical protein